VRWILLLLLLLNGIVYLAGKSEKGFDTLAERVASTESTGNIQLLSELGESLAGDEAEVEVQSGIVSKSELPALIKGQCLVLGPVMDVSFIRGAQEKNTAITAYSEEYERGADYWVYLGPYSSFGVASKVSSELRAKRIDNFVIRKGELKDAVSLGVFTDAERAATHAKGLIKKRYAAEIRRIAKMATRYWLVLEGGNSDVDYTQIEALMAGIADDNKKLRKKSCNLIASYKQLD